MSAEIKLAVDQLEELADLIADRLQSRDQSTKQLVTAAQLAGILGVDTKSIYRHADKFGAVRVGRRLRFDPAVALAGARASTLAIDEGKPVCTRATKRKKTTTTSPALLPVGRRS